jgi:Xaa-Pro aminopeptidase
MSSAAVQVQAPRIPDEEFADRIRRFKEKMAQDGLDLVVGFSNLLDPSAVRYFADVSPINESAAFLIPLEGDPILCSGQACHEWSRYHSKIKDIRVMPEVGEVSGVEYNLEVEDFEDLFAEMKRKTRIAKIGIIGDLIFPYEIYRKLEKVFPDAVKTSAEGRMYEMRMRKSEHELACIRHAGEIISATFEYAVGRLMPGSTELDIQADIESQMLRLGAEAYTHSWAPMIPSGPMHSNLCMNRNTLRKVQEGEIIDLQAGTLYEGYNAVICTPVVLGPVPDEMREAINAAREALNLVAGQLKPGVTSRQLFKTYTDYLDKTGYRQFTPYGSVHSLGMLECESPFFSATKDVVLVENAVVAIDAYFKGLPWGSFRIEETFIVHPGGPELVTTFNSKYLDRYCS